MYFDTRFQSIIPLYFLSFYMVSELGWGNNETVPHQGTYCPRWTFLVVTLIPVTYFCFLMTLLFSSDFSGHCHFSGEPLSLVSPFACRPSSGGLLYLPPIFWRSSFSFSGDFPHFCHIFRSLTQLRWLFWENFCDHPLVLLTASKTEHPCTLTRTIFAS